MTPTDLWSLSSLLTKGVNITLTSFINISNESSNSQMSTYGLFDDYINVVAVLHTHRPVLRVHCVWVLSVFWQQIYGKKSMVHKVKMHRHSQTPVCCTSAVNIVMKLRLAVHWVHLPSGPAIWSWAAVAEPQASVLSECCVCVCLTHAPVPNLLWLKENTKHKTNFTAPILNQHRLPTSRTVQSTTTGFLTDSA